MFKTAASRLAHNTTLPALGGNKDIRPLQDLITAEKTVIIALQKLSADYSKAAEALRAWGQAEGDDLGDILSASTALLVQFSAALSQYAAHGHTIRETLKSIRSREEALDELKRRRRTVHRKAEDADKKLSKMGPEHKHLDVQTELLHRLQDEIRSLDSEIMTEEAQLGDFKRASTRIWLGLKFGGLLECCEKGTIVGEYGKLLVSEIPEEITQPGMPRSLYYGHTRINALVNDAISGVGQISIGSTGRPPLPIIPPKESFSSLDSPIGGGPGQYPVPPPSAGGSGLYPPPGGSYAPSLNTLPTPAKGPLDAPLSSQAVDDFGVPIRQDGAGGNGGAARFATFPVKLRQDSLPTNNSHHAPPPFLHSPLTPPSLHTRNDIGGDSFSLSIAEALEGKKDVLGGELPPPTPAKGGSPPLSATTGGGANWVASNSTPNNNNNNKTFPETNPWATPPKQDDKHLMADSQHRRTVSQLSDNDDALLAYMTGAEVGVESDDDDDEEGFVTTRKPQPQAVGGTKPVGTKEDANDAKPPRIQSVKIEVYHGDDDDDDDDDQDSIGPQKQPQPQRSTPESKRVARVPPPTFDPEPEKPEKDWQKELDAAAARELTKELEVLDFVPPKISASTSQDSTSHTGSAPTSPKAPRVDRQEPPHEEQHQHRPQQHSLSSQHQQQPQYLPEREESPLIPPSAPFTQRVVSPHPYPETQPGLPSPPRGSRTAGSPPAQPSFQLQDPGSGSALSSPKPTAAQAIAQAYHQQHQGGAGGVPTSPYDTVYPPPHQQQQQQQQQQQIPPRFQAAYGLEAQGVPPPRFQGMRTGSSPVPPRFQNQQQQPPFEGGSAEQLPRTSVESIGGGSAQQSPLSSPYRTPLEYPASSNASSPRLGGGLGLGSASPGSNSTSPLVPSGARTISAAAFKRPQQQPSLPPMGFGSASPYPVINAPPPLASSPPSMGLSMGQGQGQQPRQQQGPVQQQQYAEPTAMAPTASSGGWQPHTKQHLRVSRDLPPPPPGAAPPRPESEYYDSSFDYIGAYAQSDQGSPMSGEFPPNANANQHQHNRQSGGPRPMSGYYPPGGVPAGLSPGQVIPPSAQQGSYLQHQQGGVGGGYPNSMSGSGGAAAAPSSPPSVLSPGYGQQQQQQQPYGVAGRYNGNEVDGGLR